MKDYILVAICKLFTNQSLLFTRIISIPTFLCKDQKYKKYMKIYVGTKM